jgi:esterase/lipase
LRLGGDKSTDLRSGEVILREAALTVKELRRFERSTHCAILDQKWEQTGELTLRFLQRAVV